MVAVYIGESSNVFPAHIHTCSWTLAFLLHIPMSELLGKRVWSGLHSWDPVGLYLITILFMQSASALQHNMVTSEDHKPGSPDLNHQQGEVKPLRSPDTT